MKAWTSKKDSSYSPKITLSVNPLGSRKSRSSRDMDFASRSKQHFLVRRLKSQLKAFSKVLTQEALSEMERS